MDQPSKDAKQTPAGGSLFDAYLAKRSDLVRFFTRRTGSVAAAEDIVQELFLKLPVDPGVDVRSPEALLYRIGSNIMPGSREADAPSIQPRGELGAALGRRRR